MKETWPPHVSPMLAQRWTKLGVSAQIFWRAARFPAQSWALPRDIMPAIELGQVEFGFDAFGIPEALITWAFLSDEVLDELLANPQRPLHLAEWNEGTNLWVAALYGTRVGVIRLLRRTLEERFAGFDRIRGFVRNSNATVARMVDRSRDRACRAGCEPAPRSRRAA